MLPVPMMATVLSEMVILVHLSRGSWLGGQDAAQVTGGLRYGCPRRGGADDRVEQDEVVDRAAVADLGHGHAGLGEPARVGLALVAEHVVLAVDDQGRGAARATG